MGVAQRLSMLRDGSGHPKDAPPQDAKQPVTFTSYLAARKLRLTLTYEKGALIESNENDLSFSITVAQARKSVHGLTHGRIAVAIRILLKTPELQCWKLSASEFQYIQMFIRMSILERIITHKVAAIHGPH
jgi:hypothetical protein